MQNLKYIFKGRYLYFLLLGFYLFLLTTCHKPVHHDIQFYHWKTNVTIGEVEQAYFSQLKSTKLYIRFFDIDRQNGQIGPVAKLRPFDPKVLHTVYIPVVFITNRTFTDISDVQLSLLIENILALTTEISIMNQLPEVTEIQIDCDWTESTKQAYFYFLEKLKEVSGKRISCTLRLHQIKFSEKTGIPPVDKGYLMCYATSDPTGDPEQNSILDMELLKDYTSSIHTYPLGFDIALPIYSWAVVKNHLGKIKLINNVSVSDLDTAVFRRINEDIYELQRDYFFRSFYLNKGFTLKVEGISPALLQEAKLYLEQKIRRPYDIVYYHLDEAFLKQFTIQNLQ